MKAAETKSVATPAKKNSPFFSKESEQHFFGSAEKQPSYFFQPKNNNTGIQTKLTIGQPGDMYEKEADAMADKVVQRLSENTRGVTNKNRNLVQAKPIAPITPVTSFVQAKCATCEQEEKLQKKEKEDEKELLKDKLQKKPIFESNAQLPDEDEKNIQRKCAECEQEEKLQKKENLSSQAAFPNIESSLSSSKGSGNSLPAATREQMENSIGADFSNVRLHTNSSAVQMNNDLQAQAFTHGSDIYFNAGKYDANSNSGKLLLAHELTHVVQQGGTGTRTRAESRNSENKFLSTPEPVIQGFDLPFGYETDFSWSGVKTAAGLVGSGAKKAGKWAYDQGTYIAGNAIECAKATGKSAWKLMTGDYSSLSDLIGIAKPQGDGPTILEGIMFVVNHPCLKMIPGYRFLLSAVKKIPEVVNFLKGVWRMLQNPSEIIEAIHNSAFLNNMIGAIPQQARALAQKAITFSEPLQEHLEGIWRHLEPKIEYLAENWWEVLKETGMDLLWPWPGVGKDLEEIWDYAQKAGNQLWDLNFSAATDNLLAIWRTVNSMFGRLYGWFFIASVLIGAIIGAIFGAGVGAIPGAIAGASFALAVGEALLISMIAAETASIGKAGLDLAFGEQTEEENEEDYEQIASSGLALAITGVMFVLGALAARFIKGLLTRVRGLFRKKPSKFNLNKAKVAEATRQKVIQEGIKKLDDKISKGKIKMPKEDLDWLNADPRNKELAFDVAKSKYSVQEAKAALKAEQQGTLKAPVKRSTHAGDDFIDGSGKTWDHKWADPNKSIDVIVDEAIALSNTGENIMLDLTSVNPVKANLIRIRVALQNMATKGQIIFVPNGLPGGGVAGGVAGQQAANKVP